MGTWMAQSLAQNFKKYSLMLSKKVLLKKNRFRLLILTGNTWSYSKSNSVLKNSKCH